MLTFLKTITCVMMGITFATADMNGGSDTSQLQALEQYFKNLLHPVYVQHELSEQEKVRVHDEV